MEQFVMQLTFI